MRTSYAFGKPEIASSSGLSRHHQQRVSVDSALMNSDFMCSPSGDISRVHHGHLDLAAWVHAVRTGDSWPAVSSWRQA